MVRRLVDTINNVSTGMHYRSSDAAPALGSRDPITDAIGLLRPQVELDAHLHAAGPWAVRFSPFPHVKLGIVARGGCWLTLDGHDPVRLRERDFYLLGAPPAYTFADTPTTEPVAAESLWVGAVDGAVRIGVEADEDTYLCGGSFFFDDAAASNLMDALPPLVHVPAADPRAELLIHLSELLVAEVGMAAAGRSLVLDHLAQIMFVHILRFHVEQTARPAGWLRALGDDSVGVALRAMHADIARRWTLNELAAISHMSRSTFAATFRAKVGTSPLGYLIEWRMNLARDALRRGTHSISELARLTGYESESAFSTAFRRVVGASPKHFRDAPMA